MNKQVLLLLATLLALLVSSAAIKNEKTGETIINPFALIDEAEAKLQTLNQTVQGSILAAENSFNIGYLEIVSYGSDALREARIAVDQGYDSAVAKLNTIKDEASSADVDISTCTDDREQQIDQLPDDVKHEVQVCIILRNEEANSVIDEYRYIVDITVTNVNQFEDQLRSCESTSILCIEPIVTQIELANVQLRQNIQDKVNEASDLLEAIKPEIDECEGTNVEDFTNNVNFLVGEISTCVDGILG